MGCGWRYRADVALSVCSKQPTPSHYKVTDGRENILAKLNVDGFQEGLIMSVLGKLVVMSWASAAAWARALKQRSWQGLPPLINPVNDTPAPLGIRAGPRCRRGCCASPHTQHTSARTHSHIHFTTTRTHAARAQRITLVLIRTITGVSSSCYSLSLSQSSTLLFPMWSFFLSPLSASSPLFIYSFLSHTHTGK